jgi:asparagine synthase (glutamine-hydrolysing)
MCGITGYWSTTTTIPDPAAVLTGMCGAIRHRGPDDEGIWTDPALGIGLGQRRLSIIDLSERGHQPMWSPSRRFVAVFNGEIYNYRELRRELDSDRISGDSDTAVAMAAFDAWGVLGALRRFAGMFAFALWDAKEQQLWLVRDRLGEKPLYFGFHSGSLFFGSELKALRAFPHWSPSIDRTALTDFLHFGYVPGPRSIYAGVSKVRPGTAVSWRVVGGSLSSTEHEYWSARDAASRGLNSCLDLSEEEATDRLEALLRDVIRDEMIADVPLGAFLSGGIDSSLVVALMQTVHSQPVRTFSIGFNEELFNEAAYARQVAEHIGTNHTELYVTADDARAVIPRLPELYDEPFADPSQIPTHLVAKLAKAHVKVALSGDGGDELFGGYNRYSIGEHLWKRISPVPVPVRRAFASALRAVPPATWDGISVAIQKRRKRHPYAISGDRVHKLAGVLASPSGDTLYDALITHWADAERVVLGGAPSAAHPSRGHVGREIMDRMMFADSVGYLPDDILVKVDRATMAVSLESRAPLLDHRLFEFAWSLPRHFKVRDGRGKWLLRQVLYRHVPRALIERPKMGFGVPLDSWLRGPLREWAGDLLAPERVRREGYFDANRVWKKWTEHQSGVRNWQYQLWDVLMFQAWNAR